MKKFWDKILQSLNVNGRDLPLLLFSLLLAFSIWLIYNLDLRYNDYLQVPVVAKCNIEGHTAVSANKNDVIARCRTTGYNIVRIKHLRKKSPVEIPFAKMQQKSPEMFYVTSNDLLEFSHIIFGENVSIDYFLTDTLFFRFPFELSKRVPVRTVSDIDLKPQYAVIGDMDVVPDSVTIYGEPYRLENIDYVYTEPIKLSGLDSDVRGLARLEKIKGIRFPYESVKYSLSVSRYVEIPRTVTIGTRNVPKGKELMTFPSTAKVMFRCIFPYTVDDALKQVSFYVDYEDFINSISGKCVVRADSLPDGVIGYVVEPQVFDCVASEM